MSETGVRFRPFCTVFLLRPETDAHARVDQKPPRINYTNARFGLRSCRIFLTLLLLLSSSMASLWAQDPGNGIAGKLARARELIQAGNTSEALQLLDSAVKEAAEIESENLDLREELLFEAANDNLNFAQTLINPAQYHFYAEKARERLLDYINWFNNLSPANVKSLKRNRIETVTAFLGNADIRMGDQQKLFTDYGNIPKVSFLGPDAVELWKSTLYTCPDWQAVSSLERRDPNLRQRKVCTDACTEEWRVYALTLEEWAKTFYLRAVVRESKVREAQQIIEIAKRCQQQ